MKNRSIHALLAASTLAVALPVAAQAPTKAPAPAPAPATTAAPAPAAAPAPISPEQRVAIKEFMDTTSTRDNLPRSFQQMSQSLPAQMGQAIARGIDANTSLTLEQKQKALENMRQPYENAVKEGMTIVNDPKLVDDALEKMFPIYAKYFTAAEMKQITAFYKTPIGAKMLTTMPQVINESMLAGIQIVQPKLAGLVDKALKTQPGFNGAPAPAATPAPAKGSPKKQP